MLYWSIYTEEMVIAPQYSVPVYNLCPLSYHRSIHTGPENNKHKVIRQQSFSTFANENSYMTHGKRFYCDIHMWLLRDVVAQWVTGLTGNRPVVSLSPIKGSCCFVEQEASRSLLGTGWLQELIQVISQYNSQFSDTLATSVVKVLIIFYDSPGWFYWEN